MSVGLERRQKKFEVTRAPLLGEHTEQVLAELGYGAEDLALLRAEKVI